MPRRSAGLEISVLSLPPPLTLRDNRVVRHLSSS
jgi:hypothetical protein